MPAARFRVINIGNSDKEHLLVFIDVIEAELGQKTIRNYMPMQTNDGPTTWADASMLQNLPGYRPETSLQEGMTEFLTWYRAHCNA